MPSRAHMKNYEHVDYGIAGYHYTDMSDWRRAGGGKYRGTYMTDIDAQEYRKNANGHDVPVAFIEYKQQLPGHSPTEELRWGQRSIVLSASIIGIPMFIVNPCRGYQNEHADRIYVVKCKWQANMAALHASQSNAYTSAEKARKLKNDAGKAIKQWLATDNWDLYTFAVIAQNRVARNVLGGDRVDMKALEYLKLLRDLPMPDHLKYAVEDDYERDWWQTI